MVRNVLGHVKLYTKFPFTPLHYCENKNHSEMPLHVQQMGKQVEQESETSPLRTTVFGKLALTRKVKHNCTL